MLNMMSSLFEICIIIQQALLQTTDNDIVSGQFDASNFHCSLQLDLLLQMTLHLFHKII